MRLTEFPIRTLRTPILLETAPIFAPKAVVALVPAVVMAVVVKVPESAHRSSKHKALASHDEAQAKQPIHAKQRQLVEFNKSGDTIESVLCG
jgi:uncharacterized membrane-anchored protein YitT (DUF2179 family)